MIGSLGGRKGGPRRLFIEVICKGRLNRVKNAGIWEECIPRLGNSNCKGLKAEAGFLELIKRLGWLEWSGQERVKSSLGWDVAGSWVTWGLCTTVKTLVFYCLVRQEPLKCFKTRNGVIWFTLTRITKKTREEAGRQVEGYCSNPGNGWAGRICSF